MSLLFDNNIVLSIRDPACRAPHSNYRKMTLDCARTWFHKWIMLSVSHAARTWWCRIGRYQTRCAVAIRGINHRVTAAISRPWSDINLYVSYRFVSQYLMPIWTATRFFIFNELQCALYIFNIVLSWSTRVRIYHMQRTWAYKSKSGIFIISYTSTLLQAVQ